jgi:hypothetical protein
MRYPPFWGWRKISMLAIVTGSRVAQAFAKLRLAVSDTMNEYAALQRTYLTLLRRHHEAFGADLGLCKRIEDAVSLLHHLWPGETADAIAIEAKRIELEKGLAVAIVQSVG